jgi:hypothetical protein
VFSICVGNFLEKKNLLFRCEFNLTAKKLKYFLAIIKCKGKRKNKNLPYCTKFSGSIKTKSNPQITPSSNQGNSVVYCQFSILYKSSLFK